MSDESRDRVVARLTALLDPATTAVLTMEMQEGTVGAFVVLPALSEEVARTGMLDVVRRVCAGARAAGVQVVHCTHEVRPDGAGTTLNCSIFVKSDRLRRETGAAPTQIGTPGVEVVAGLLDDRDIVVGRLTGMTPFTSTSLDQVLRNLGIRTVVVTGASLNLGVFGTCLSALDLGYQVVLVRDAVVGVPADYAQAVIDNSLSLITTVTTADELLAVLDDVGGSAG
jgi:nicotinamidase-related amidase